jgi:hypothetical protein
MEVTKGMNKQAVRNVLVVFGIWSLSRMIAWGVRALFIPVSNHLIYTGDTGIVMMWLWEAFPDALVAGLAAVTLVWVTETTKSLSWLGGLVLLCLYGGAVHAARLLTRGWHTPPRTPDYVGILPQAIIPALTCLIVGVWRLRRIKGTGQSNL